MTSNEIADAKARLCVHILSEIPNFKIIEKSKSPLMKFINVVLFFVPKFMSRFTTTIYPKVYSKCDPKNIRISTLAHEFVHLRDRKRFGQLFNFLYLFPQILAVIAILASVLSLWWLFALICLLPMPAIGRAWSEFRGYRMSLAVVYWVHGLRLKSSTLASKFCGASYYFMFPFKKYLVKKFDKAYDDITSGVLTEELCVVHNIIFSKQ